MTDNDWFAYGILLKHVWPKVLGIRPKTTIYHWAKERVGVWNHGLRSLTTIMGDAFNN